MTGVMSNTSPLTNLAAIGHFDLLRRFGLKTVGVVGVLIEAKARGPIAEVGPLLERLRQEVGFYLSDRVIQAARAFCGEV